MECIWVLSTGTSQSGREHGDGSSWGQREQGAGSQPAQADAQTGKY